MLIFFSILGAVGLLLGVPIFMCFVVAAGLVCVIQLGVPWQVLGHSVFMSVTKYVLLAIPLFIFAAQLVYESGQAQRLCNFFIAFVGHWRGGLGIALVLTMGFFGAMCGSVLAAIVAIGAIFIPLMVEQGYPKGFCAALVAASAGLDSLIPPSNGAIVFASITETSVEELFAAGMIPGILQMVLLLLASRFLLRKMKTQPPASWGERWQETRRAAPVLLLPFIILGSIFSGWLFATEAAAVACAWALLVGCVYRALTWGGIWRALKRSAEATGMIFAIIAAASLLSLVLTYTEVPQGIANWCFAKQLDTSSFLFMLAVAVLILGLFMEAVPNRFIAVPISYPVSLTLGIPVTHLYTIDSLATGIGLLTPPVSVGAFTAASVADVPITSVYRYLFPVLLGTLILSLFINVYVPWLSTWFPSVIMG